MYAARWRYPVLNKMALQQLTFEKRKWIYKCYWKMENVTEVQRRWRNESGSCWWDFLNVCDLECRILQLCIYLYVSYEYPKCVNIFGGQYRACRRSRDS
jgi:hypothetical protein